MDTPTRFVYELGDFRLLPEEHQLSFDGEAVHLRPKTFLVLRHLVERHGHVVTRQELLGAVWPEVHVDETVLSRSIWEIRDALRRGDGASDFIETVPKVGYRFVGPVRVIEEGSRVRDLEAGPIPRRRRAVVVAVGLALVGLAAGLSLWAVREGPEDPVPGAVPLTTDPALENWPTFSPDGSHVAFQRGTGGEQAAIFVKKIGEATAWRRSTGEGLDHAASWSPDGRWIAFMRGQDLPNGPLQLVVLPALEGAERVLAHVEAPVGWGFRPAWTPDGRGLIVPDGGGPDSRRLFDAHGYSLHRVSLEDGSRSPWLPPVGGSGGRGDTDPTISPDGTRLAFARNGDLHVVAVDDHCRPSGAPREVTSLRALAGPWGTGGPWGLAWTADSREIVFSAGSWPRPRLYRVSASGGQARLLNGIGPGAFAPAISRAGHRLAYLEWISRADIWHVQLGEGYRTISEPHRLVDSSRVDFDPVYSPDGTRIAFHSNRSGTWGVWTATASGEEARLLSAYEEAGDPWARRAGFSWSPDGLSIAFADGDVYVVDVESETRRPLTSDGGPHEFPLWSPEGRWIHFSSRTEGSWRVARVPSDGGPHAPVGRERGRLLAISPDGLDLYVVRDEKLWAVPTGGGGAREVLDSAPLDVVAWENGLVYSLIVPTPVIRRLDLETGRSRDVLRPEEWTAGLSLSPDGRKLAYGQFAHARADLMLVDGFE